MQEDLAYEATYEKAFIQSFLSDAVVYRDEANRRLNDIPPNDIQLTMIFQGHLAGPYPELYVAGYLEGLAKRLP